VRVKSLSDNDGPMRADHLKVTIPTGFAVRGLAHTCLYHKATLSKLVFTGGGESDFGSAGTASNEKLFGGRNAYEWCKREVRWGADWLQKAHIESGSGSAGIVIQVRLDMLLTSPLQHFAKLVDALVYISPALKLLMPILISYCEIRARHVDHL
jgi:hypothetical protein